MTDNTDNKDGLLDVENLPEFMKEGIRLSIARQLLPDEVRERSFRLLNGVVIYGLCIGEMHDSFLVGLAATLFKNDNGEIGVHFISKARVERVFKSSIASVGFCDIELRKAYFMHLLLHSDKVPDLLTEERCATIKQIMYTDPDKSESEPGLSSENESGKPSRKSKNLFDSVPDYMADYSIHRH